LTYLFCFIVEIQTTDPIYISDITKS